MAATRQAKAIWTGDLAKGSGEVSALSSKQFDGLPVSWAARTEAPEGKTSPEELLASAHAGCLGMSLASELANPDARVEVHTTIRMDEVDGKGHQIVASTVAIRGRVPGLSTEEWRQKVALDAIVPGADEETFTKLVEDAKDNCPISKALEGNVALSVTAKLHQRSEARASS